MKLKQIEWSQPITQCKYYQMIIGTINNEKIYISYKLCQENPKWTLPKRYEIDADMFLELEKDEYPSLEEAKAAAQKAVNEYVIGFIDLTPEQEADTVVFEKNTGPINIKM